MRSLDRLCGSMVALATPFAADGRLDEVAFTALCERQIAAGSRALVPGGASGEAPTLTQTEQDRLIALAVRAARGRVPVIAATGSNCTATTIAMVAAAEQLGADAALCVVPYYNRPSQEGLFRHFAAVAASTALPVLLHDDPRRCGVALELETIVRLSQEPNVVGLKDASGDLGRARRLRTLLAPTFLRLCGDDALIAPALALGGQGIISAATNLIPALMATLHEAWRRHESERVELLLRELDPLFRGLALDTSPVPLKWAMSDLGLTGGTLRRPLLPLAPCHHDRLRAAVQGVLAAEHRAQTRMVAGRSPRPAA